MKIPSIFVGCGPFGLQRLKVLIEKTNFLPVACVDKNVSNAKKRLSENAETKKLKLHKIDVNDLDKPASKVELKPPVLDFEVLT